MEAATPPLPTTACTAVPKTLVFLTSGISSRAPFEACHLDDEPAALFESGRAQPVDAAEKSNVLIDRQPLVKRKPLRHVADSPLHRLGVAADVDAVDQRRSAGRPEQTAQHPD